MREIKSRYPANRVHVVFTGDEGFLAHPSIQSAKNYGGRVEIVLREGGSAQELLAYAVGQGTAITQFQVMEPTLEEIFIETVGAKVDA